MATALGVDASTIVLSISSGSITVSATISTTTKAASEAVSSSLASTLAAMGAGDAFFGQSVAAVPDPPTTSVRLLTAPSPPPPGPPPYPPPSPPPPSPPPHPP
eukprot:3588979-Prymnesium_polylepis.1